MNITEQKLKEDVTNNETRKHISNVGKFTNIIVKELLDRAQKHDASKLVEPELEAFTKHTENLASCTYGSHQYDKFLEELKPALEHHYANNMHHPEHYPNGINGMNLIDLIEMFVDWKAASLRHNDGNLLKSIAINSKRFSIDSQLTKIFENTADILNCK
jgi:hypothetical protein